jgi:hypothetical protein
MLLRTVMTAAAASMALYASQAMAQPKEQPEDQITVYSRGNFKGAQYRITGPTRGMEVPFTVRSVALPAGASWELCTGNKFSGCRQFSQSDPSTVVTVRSARPAPSVIRVAPGTTAATAAGVPGQSLRGMASEFFVAPGEGGSRIAVRPGTAEAATRAAEEFCRAHGWRSSAYERLQTVGQSFYLADVLCSDTGL